MLPRQVYITWFLTFYYFFSCFNFTFNNNPRPTTLYNSSNSLPCVVPEMNRPASRPGTDEGSQRGQQTRASHPGLLNQACKHGGGHASYSRDTLGHTGHGSNLKTVLKWIIIVTSNSNKALCAWKPPVILSTIPWMGSSGQWWWWRWRCGWVFQPRSEAPAESQWTWWTVRRWDTGERQLALTHCWITPPVSCLGSGTLDQRRIRPPPQ